MKKKLIKNNFKSFVLITYDCYIPIQTAVMQCHIRMFSAPNYPWDTHGFTIYIILSEGSLWEDKSKLNFTRFQT